MKNAAIERKNILRGVSTLDLLSKYLTKILPLLLLALICGGPILGAGGHSTLDMVDPSFNPQIQANLYGGKSVYLMETLPDGKILVFGDFSSYNRAPVGKLVRLHPDGSLDTTFDHQTITSTGYCSGNNLFVQPDAKIIVGCRDMVAGGQAAKNLIRLNADGTLDTSFDYTLGSYISRMAVDSIGRVVIHSLFQTPMGQRFLVRLHPDGSLDTSFNYTQNFTTTWFAAQGSRVIVGGGNAPIIRLNENGSVDTSFAASSPGGSVNYLLVQTSGKVLYLKGNGIFRLNADGGNDASFQPTPIFDALTMKIGADGRIVISGGIGSTTVRRFLADGGADPSFTPSAQPAASAFAIQSDGGIIVGDTYNPTTTEGINNFVRLTPGGAPDAAFNPGGLGFQNILPGSIRAIEPTADGKILLGGKFDLINNINRIKLARLNADSSVDPSFEINTGGSGNRFSLLQDVYRIRRQADGKILVSGWFDYVQNGVNKKNLVRLNSDGSIDPTFNLTEPIHDYSEVVGAGRNPLIPFTDGRLMIGISKLNNLGPVGPLLLNSDGSRDLSFTSMLNASSAHVYIDDIELQPDGKILVGGSHDPDNGGHRTFLARLSADGSVDPTYTYTQETGRLKPTLALLPNGKFLVGRHSSGMLFGRVERRNADGTADNTFNGLSIPNGIINALLVLPNGKTFVGGQFVVTVNGREIRNLLRLDADGNIESTAYNVNEEVLSLALDGQGRLLVGGRFTTIDTDGGSGASRTYVARLTDQTPFDFDGDGRADVSVFRPSENKWYILRSSDGQVAQQIFAVAGDVPAPADFDGDGKTDISVYRASQGDWWSLSSQNGQQMFADWGEAGVVPRPSDFDGDGKSDYIFYLPSNSTWYRYGSSAGASYVQFGLSGDKPITGDFDGDGKSDVAIFRPSTGDWWWKSSIDGAQRATHWGISTDIPAPADYDGDGKTDFAVYRPSNGTWYVYNSSTLTSTILNFGLSEDKPVPADYDGDGKEDIAVFRPSTGVWYLMRSSEGFAALQFGVSTDQPTPNAFVP